jgi:LysM repeat protein
MRVFDLFTEAEPNLTQAVRDLAQANNISNPNLIRVGQKIKLPDGSTYTVAAGDTLSGIASGQFKGAAANAPASQVKPGPNPNIKPDTRQRAGTAATAPTPAPTSGEESAISAVVNSGPGYVDVKTTDGQVQRRQGVRNWRNNNPGNIIKGAWAQSKGAIGDDGRFAVFPTLELGLKAKQDLLFAPNSKYYNLSIAAAMNRYAPPTENNTQSYIQRLVQATGASPDTPLSRLSSTQRDAFLKTINQVEGFKVGQIKTLDQPLRADIHEEENPEDIVKLDVPLLLRIMEYSKEDAETDMDLHHVVEKLVDLSADGSTLDMDNYNDIVGSVNEDGDAPAEKLIKDIQYDPDQQQNPRTYKIAKDVVSAGNGTPRIRYVIKGTNGQKVGPGFDSMETARDYLRRLNQGDINEGHGRYWCSTDKRWKERQGPKQSRG